jgi:hypothetical protein
MKIRYLSGPKAGQEEQVQNQIGNVVVGAGLAEVIPSNEPPRDQMGHVTIPPPPLHVRGNLKPEWDVIVMTYGADRYRYLTITVKLLNQVSTYTGSPDHFPPRLGCWPIPDDIKAYYRREYLNNPALQDTATADGQRMRASRQK